MAHSHNSRITFPSKDEWIAVFKEIGFGESDSDKFAGKFFNAEISKNVLKSLNDDDLRTMGIEALGKRKLILQWFKNNDGMGEKSESLGDSYNEKKKIQHPVALFRTKLQYFNDSEIKTIHRYETFKLIAYAVELFTSSINDLTYKQKEMVELEKDVVSRGLIEITEERFLGDRRAKQNKNLSHEEKMKKILELDHPEIKELKKRIAEDDKLDLQTYPQYSALAHDHFSSRIHQYIHRKRNIECDDYTHIDGVFPGRSLALRAVRILFSTICSPKKGGHKRFFIKNSNEGISRSNPFGTIPNQFRLNRHIIFSDSGDVVSDTGPKRKKEE